MDDSPRDRKAGASGTIRLAVSGQRPPLHVRACEVAIIDGPDRGRTYRLQGTAWRVGKGPGNDIVLSDGSVSRSHLSIEEATDGYVVRDLGSTNGTLVNDVQTREARVSGTVTVVIGATALRLTPVQSELAVQKSRSSSFAGLIGASAPMRELYGYLEKVAPTDLSVMLLGQTGTGKEMVARAIHKSSARRDGPFVVFDCAACEAGLVAATLFGHREGAFTGATGSRKGAFASAHRGTLFIDEIGELPLDLQPKLLRALELREVQPLGSDSTVLVDVRVVFATHRDIEALVAGGKFREDLYFRLAGLVLELPALRDRPGDVMRLAEHFASRLAPPRALGATAVQTLEAHRWTGNVRELKNVIERAAALHEETVLEARHLMLGRPRLVGSSSLSGSDAAATPARSGPPTMEDAERQAILAALEATGWNKTHAARALGISRQTLRIKLERYGLVPKGESE